MVEVGKPKRINDACGTLEHRDSMGDGRQLKTRWIRHLSAGSGVARPEHDPTRFLPIWIKPHSQGLAPVYSFFDIDDFEDQCM